LSTLKLQVPRKLQPLLQPKRYKGAYGGRGGAKSHFFAEQIIIKCFTSPTRVVCIREVQNSIKDSVKQLLSDKINHFGLGTEFEVLDSEIRCKNGSFIIFKGMQSYNATNIKSLEAFNIAWVEEAQTLSQLSLDMLRPTLREDGSELWFSWNPRFKTDPVDKFFRKQPPAEAISVLINWRDNPWFPKVLMDEMLHDFEIDEDKAEHVWNGAYGSLQGSILGKLVGRAEREGRIHNNVAYDKEGSPIFISSDIGFYDTASWWYWQPKPRGFSLLKYEGESGFDADDWIPRIEDNLLTIGVKKDMLGKIWLPHDAKVKTFQSKHSTVEKFLTKFGAGKVGIVPISKKSDQISAARNVLPRCEFHKDNCEKGLDGLMAWEFKYNEETNAFSREPLHNWASHPSDGYAYGAQVMQEYIESPLIDETLKAISVGESGVINVSLNELWDKQGNQKRY
jgi:phage terminase large subunit